MRQGNAYYVKQKYQNLLINSNIICCYGAKVIHLYQNKNKIKNALPLGPGVGDPAEIEERKLLV